MRTVRTRIRGFSLIEVIVTLVIVAILMGIFVANLAGTKGGDKIDRAVQQIYDDLILIRSRAVSTNANHRVSFATAAQWRIQQYEPVSATWVNVGDIRNMPSDTQLTTGAFTNAASNLESTPRGLFTFLNSATGSPYVTVSTLGVSRTKSINVYVGGALEITTP